MAIDVGPAPTNEHLSSDPSPLRSDGRRPRWWWFGLGGLVTAAFVWAVAGSLSLFPLLTQNADEGAYLAQSAALRAGQVVPDAPAAHPDAFMPWFAVLRDGHYVYKYSPVYPAFLAVGHWLFGSERGALGILAAGLVLLVVLFARELGLSRRGALLAGTAFLLAPVFLIQSATFLPYIGNLALLLVFAVMLLRGARTGNPWMVVAAGCALGVAFWLRPFDAILFGAPIIVWHLARPPSSLGRGRTVALLVVGTLPGLAGFFAYNTIATGSPFDLPFRLLDQADTIGFGRRRTLSTAGYVDYTVELAWRATQKNVLLLITWSFGNAVLVILAVFGYLSKPRLRDRSLLLVMLVAWPAGFFFFWGSYTYVYLWSGGNELGPWYYLPMLVPLSVAAGLGLDRGLRRSVAVSVIAVALCFAVAIPLFADAVSSARDAARPREAVDDALRSATNGRKSLVFLPGPVLQFPFSFLRNAPDYGGDRLFAIERGNLDLAVAREYGDRLPFVLSLPNGYQTTADRALAVWVDRESIVSGPAVEVAVEVPAELADATLGLELGFGTSKVETPIQNREGRLRVSMDPTGRVVVATLDGAQSVAIPKLAVGWANGLQLALVQHVSGQSSRALVRRLVPTQVAGANVSILWPGVLTGSVLPPETTIGWSAERPRSHATP